MGKNAVSERLFSSPGREEAPGDLPLAPVIGHAFAAVAPFVARCVGTGAMLQGFGGDAIHNNLGYWVSREAAKDAKKFDPNEIISAPFEGVKSIFPRQ
jgi:hypothetical protein